MPAAIANFITRIISTFFYVGYLPLVPGTFGSLAGVVIFYLVGQEPVKVLLSAAVATVLGLAFSGRMEALTGKKDPGCVVIDEVSGMLIALSFLPPHNYGIIIVVMTFLIFRLLDTTKPYPANLFQKLRGGPGIMIDDIVAGLYTNLVLQVVLRLSSARVS
jgi:phosphatidylglycerophosphatase A